ncbi:NAD(P)/FAD-dependent oxidoreductase [Sphingomonas nostoxanthinifaciens]|uniref:NAD(P)/FAD-dependent oxidoreductase n=1 Tax=Sphingomonas nostoxanthinifaciens TaxID=2872652 RepID=UPI001CC1EF62|nr:FAD-binding oxidoreductase [Sphingomonas nostoxanthinifaciens]UAK23453.1 FAD-binding oxidoreductase [Sphingomonas nostoxanthinifaciens]
MPEPISRFPTASQSVLVVGAGVVGRAIALTLQDAGHRVVLVDPDPQPTGASLGNAGHIAVEQVEPLASRANVRSMLKRLFWRGGAVGLPLAEVATWLPFARRLIAAAAPARFAAGKRALGAMLDGSMAAWRRLLDKAEARDLLREDGHFVLWETPASAAAGLARWRATDIGGATIREVTAAERAQLAAITTTPIAGAIRFDGSGQIADLPALALALEARFRARGGTMRVARVARLAIEGGRAAAMLEDGTRLDADRIVVAAGVRSGALLATIGARVPIVAERGYHIQSPMTDWPEDMPPVVFEDRSMIVTRFRSGLRAASFVEFGRVDSPPDRRKWARLRAHVASLGLPFGLPGNEWMGARPTLPDYLPAIGTSRRAGNLIYAFGHQHLGLTLAATTAEAVAALVDGTPPPYDLTPYDLDRFGGQA